MKTLTIPCEAGSVSDGYHTFDELYEHRALLFLALMRAHHGQAWYSEHHHDGSAFEGFFIAGMTLPKGQITYHISNHYLTRASRTGASLLKRAPKFDGHTSDDVIQRLREWL